MIHDAKAVLGNSGALHDDDRNLARGWRRMLGDPTARELPRRAG